MVKVFFCDERCGIIGFKSRKIRAYFVKVSRYAQSRLFYELKFGKNRKTVMLKKK